MIAISPCLEPISIWPWSAAPIELRMLSTADGDEDFVAYVPFDMVDRWLPMFADADYWTRYELPNGAVVLIASH